jgi:hypothetical protein
MVMGRVNKMLAQARKAKRCQMCTAQIPNYPQGCVDIENFNGTQRMLICMECLDSVLKLNGVKVISDNVNRG